MMDDLGKSTKRRIDLLWLPVSEESALSASLTVRGLYVLRKNIVEQVCGWTKLPPYKREKAGTRVQLPLQETPQ